MKHPCTRILYATVKNDTVDFHFLKKTHAHNRFKIVKIRLENRM